MPTTIFFIVFITTFISFFYYKKFKGTVYCYFLYYILWTFFVELIYNTIRYYYIHYKEIIFNSNFTYNIHIIVTYLFFFLFYKTISKKNKTIYNIFVLVFVLFVLFNYFILKNNFLDGLNTNNIIVGGILLLISLILFLIEIINNEEIIFNIQKAFVFWISVGLLLFYVGIIPIMISKEILDYNETYMNVLILLNVLMYGSFVIGFIKSDTKYNY